MGCLDRARTPQLELIHQGKVRDTFRVDPETRLIVVTDRISAFDKVLGSAIPEKGAVLNGLTNWWLQRTGEIVPNHLVRAVAPNASLVREAEPILIEVVVRGYLAGSAYRKYGLGDRVISGVELPPGLRRNGRLPEPVVTPTTKAALGHDEEVTPAQIEALGLATAERWAEMARVALALFRVGTETLARQGLLLADTKYEFGLVDGELTLIDEIHTPDSSRFWDAARWERDPGAAASLDKEYVRGWLLERRGGDGEVPDELPAEVVAETSRRYLELYERVTGAALQRGEGLLDGREALARHLAGEGLIRDGWVAVVMGSPADAEHAEVIAEALSPYGVMVDRRVVSAHKNGEAIAALAEEYNRSLEPGCVIAVAGLSNGLGGALAANLDVPVISCPPFKDKVDLMLNVSSSLMMPSGVPAATVIRPAEAAAAALRALNLGRLRDRFTAEIAATKRGLAAADRAARGR